jgi:hypothetical protein
MRNYLKKQYFFWCNEYFTIFIFGWSPAKFAPRERGTRAMEAASEGGRLDASTAVVAAQGRKRKQDEAEERSGMERETEAHEWVELGWKETTVHVNDRVVQVSWTTLRSEFIDNLGPLLHQHLPRQRVPLPITFSQPVWGLVAQMLSHHHGQDWALNTDDQVREFLGRWVKKVWSRGTFALISPPMIIHFDPPKNVARITFHCVVFNKAGTKQWPIKYKSLN